MQLGAGLPTVAIDVTPAVIIRTGVGRYPTALAGELEKLAEVRVIRMAASARSSQPWPSRIAKGMLREGIYYPVGLRRRALREGAELIHCTHPAPVRAGGLPLVVTVHDLLPLSFPHLFPRTTLAHTRLSLPFVRRADRVLTNSEYTRSQVIELLGVAPERVITTPFGIDSRFRPEQPDADWLRRRFGIRRPFLLTVGTLEPRKNLRTVLRAFDLMARDLPEHSLVVVGGSGWGDRTLGAEIGGPDDRVVATGFVEDEELVGLYSAADCFVFPSLAEGFGFPPLESMACGTPVVAGNRPALPEVLGDAALLVDPTEPEEIASAVVRVASLGEVATDLEKRGIARAAGFTWRACARSTATVYRELLR